MRYIDSQTYSELVESINVAIDAFRQDIISRLLEYKKPGIEEETEVEELGKIPF